jgi:hypothetical protein
MQQLPCSGCLLQVGLGGTTQWKMAGIDLDTTVAVVLEITANTK